MVSEDRQILMMKREDGNLAGIYKTSEILRTFVISQEVLKQTMIDAMSKKITGDPWISTDHPLSIIGAFTIEGQKSTIQKILKSWEKYEIVA